MFKFFILIWYSRTQIWIGLRSNVIHWVQLHPEKKKKKRKLKTSMMVDERVLMKFYEMD